MTAPGSTVPLPARRIDAARQLLRRHHLRDSFALNRQPSLRNAVLAGSQAAITMAVALPLVHVSPWSHLIGFAALGALVALFGRFAPQGRRNRILLFSGFWQVLAVLGMSMAAWLGAPLVLQFVLLALACGGFFLAAATSRLGPPGPLIFVFAAGAAMGHVGTLQQVAERAAATAAVAALALAVCALTETLRHPATPERRFPVEPLQPLADRLIAAGRIALGAAVAIFASHAVGAAHPAWAALGALAVMQGPQLHINLSRALQRMAGTAVGALLAWLVLHQAPSVWSLIAVLTALQFATEMIIGTNYALGQILVTPMALLMSHLAAPDAAGAAMAPERVLDTLLGVSIGLVAAVLLSTLDDRRHLARRQLARDAGRTGGAGLHIPGR